MDYKEMTKVTAWVFRNVKFLAGTDARVYATILTRSNFKDSLWEEGNDFLAKELELTRQQAAKAIGRLLKVGLMTQIEPAKGRKPAVYKLRNEQDMRLMYERDEVNPEWKKWNDEHDRLFFHLETAASEIGAGCEDCASSENSKSRLCQIHRDELDKFEQQREYREMKLWERDHPKPESKRITVVKIALE